MADNIITPEFRGAFVSLFRASKPKGAPETQSPKFSIRAAFPPNTDFSAMKAEAAKASVEKWGDKVPKTARSPFRRNDELDNPIAGIGDDWVIMTFTAPESRRPGLVDANLQDIIDEVDVYSGAWFRAQVRPYAYEQQGNKGVSFGLQNVQKLRDDAPLTSNKPKVSDIFTAVGAKSASSVFE
jgi:hypothetical protein